MCKINKPYDLFYSCKHSRDGFHAYCKYCHKKRASEKYKARFERVEVKSTKLRICRICRKRKTFDNFYIHSVNDKFCKSCIPNKSYLKAITDKGISVEKYFEILKLQNNCCYICKKPQMASKTRLSIDHDHNCCSGQISCGKCFRGLLCNMCNVTLGYVKDDIELLKAMITYLEERSVDKPFDQQIKDLQELLKEDI